jgi:ABC-type Zn uptake system ZnuABC Zn-binding protein ZnuA
VKPNFIRVASRADLYVEAGMESEIGWSPAILQNARNPKVLPGNAGYLDASIAIRAMEVPQGPIDRSMGDVHPLGNPHYLLDPLNGLNVAALIRDRLTELRPAKRAYFQSRYDAFSLKISKALVGDELAKRYDEAGVRKLAALFEQGKLSDYLKDRKELSLLGGWLGVMLPHYGLKVVDDHNMFPYFAARFGLRVIGHMEPKPGIPPTTKHLTELIGKMKSEGVTVIIASPFFDQRHERFLAEKTGARVAAIAHQNGARPGTDDYIAMTEYNIRQILAAAR